MKLMKLVATACTALAITGGLFFMATHDTNAAQANGVFTLEQLSTNGYTGADSTQDGALINTDGNTKYSALMADGSVYILDNTDGKYGTLSVGTGSSNFNVLYSENSVGKTTLLNADGTYYGKLNGYYSVASLTINSNDTTLAGSYYYTDDSGVSYFCKKDGTVIGTFHFTTKVRSMIGYGDYFYIQTQNDKGLYDEGIYDANGAIVPGFSSDVGIIACIGETCMEWYKKVPDNYTGPEETYTCRRPGKYIITKYNLKLEEVNDEEFARLDKTAARKITTAEYAQHVDASAYTLPNGYEAEGTYTIDGITVVLGEATIKIDGMPTRVKALFDTNGTLLLSNVYSGYMYKNVFVIKDGTNYKYIRLQKTATGNQASTTPDNNSNQAALKSDGNGNLTGSVVAGNSGNDTFDFVTTAQAVPAGSKFSVAKVVSGQIFDAAKQVIQAVADKYIVYNIDLLNSANTKIEPDGKVQVTLPVPEGYNTAKVAVYRLAEDGRTYIKLESKVVDGKIIFITDHFSTYLITEDKGSVTATNTTPATGDSLPVNVFVICIVIAGLTLITCIRRKKSTVQ